MKRCTKMLALLLCVVMLVSLMPMSSARAASDTVRYTVLVLDTSSTSDFIDENGDVFYTAGTAIDYVKTAAKAFVKNNQGADGTNYIAVVSYRGSSASVSCPFSQDSDVLNQSIDSLQSSETTRSVAAGLSSAYDLIQSVDENSIKNVVLFTTGMTNDGPYSYDGLYDESTVGSNWRRMDTDVRLYAYSNSAIAVADQIKSVAHLYSIGLFQTMEQMPEYGKPVVEFFKLFAQDCATSANEFRAVDNPEDLEFQFGEVAGEIGSSNGPIILIPGIMGSRLYDSHDIMVWGNAWDVALSSPFRTGEELDILNPLFVRGDNGLFEIGDNGLYLEPGEEDKREYGTIDTYKNLVDFLCEEFKDRDIYFFSYDWRQTNQESAAKLKEAMDNANIRSANFICHSMGGLVISNFIHQNGTERIEHVITLGTPYEGAAKLFRAVLTNDILDGVAAVFNGALAKSGLTYQVKSQLPGVGELTPTSHSNAIDCWTAEMSDEDHQLTVQTKTRLVTPNTPLQTVSASQFAMRSRIFTSNILLNDQIYRWYSELLNDYQAKGLRVTKVAWQEKPGSITFTPYYLAPSYINYSDLMDMVYGHTNASNIMKEQADVQDAIRTLQGMNNAFFAIGNTNSTITGAVVQVDPRKSGQKVSLTDLKYGIGDGTVPLYSAEMLLNYCPNNAHYFDLNHNQLAGDKNKPEFAKVKDWISGILNNGDPGGSNSTPKRTRHIVIRIACPVDVTLSYNGEVLSSAPDTFNDEASFGRMDLIGNDSEIKMFCIDGDLDYSLTAVGTDDGTMDYTIRYLDGDYELEDEYTYTDIPLTSNTVITSDVVVDEEPVLNIDEDGDGVIDDTLHLDDPVFDLDYDTAEEGEEEEEEPIAAPTPTPSAEPEVTPAPTAEPTATPAPTAEPTVTPTPTVKPEPKPIKFVDGPEDAYYYDAVYWAVNTDPAVTTGVDETHFAPEKDCTRAQMVTFLWRANGEPEPTITKNPFTDVKSGDYFYKAVLWAVEKGITKGTTATTFSPNATVTRAQTVTFLWRMAGEPAVNVKNPFTDVKADQYYTDAVLWAVKNEVTTGKTATVFAPDDPCTRAQIVTFLYRDLV